MTIKYEVENISHNQIQMDIILNETIINKGSISSIGHDNTNADNDHCLLLPLNNEGKDIDIFDISYIKYCVISFEFVFK